MKQFLKFLPAIFVLIIGISTSVWINSNYRKTLKAQKENEINLVIANKLGNIEHELLSGFSSIELLQYLFEQQEIINNEEFKRYTVPLFRENKGLKALSWVPKITHDKRINFELELKRISRISTSVNERDSKNRLKYSDERPFYFPIYLIEPLEENQKALGFDIFSENIRKETITLCVNTGNLQITPPIKIVQDTIGKSFLAIAPVFYPTELHNSFESLKGVISGVFKIDDLVASSQSIDSNFNVKIVIYDITNEINELIYGNEDLLKVSQTSIQKRLLDIGGRKWELNFISGSEYIDFIDSNVYLIFGIAVSLMLFFLLIIPFIIEKRRLILTQKLLKEQDKRNLIETSLNESEAYNRMLFNLSPIGLALTKVDGKLVDVNKTYAAIIGRTVEETLQLSYWDITPEKYIDQERVQLESLKRNGHYGPYEKEYIHKNGNFIPVRLQGKIIKRKGVKYIWSSIENISTQKISEEKINASENKFKALVEQSITGIYIFEKDKFHYVNKRFTEIFGYTEQEILANLKPTDVVIPEERPIAQENIKKRLEGNVSSVHYVARGKHKTNKELWIEIHGTHIELDGKDVITGTVLDITERKIAEEALRDNEIKFRSIFENSVDAIGVSKNGIHEFVNPSYLKLFGYTYSNELINLAIVDLIAPTERLKILENVKKRKRDKSAPYNYETIGLKKDGTEFNMDVHVSEYLIKNENFTLVILRDITEKKKAEADLLASKTKLEAALGSMSDALFISDIKGNFIHFNEAFATFHKFNSKDDCAKTFAEYPGILDVLTLEGELVPTDRWAVPSALRGETGANVEFRIRRKDSGETWIGSYNYAPIYGENMTIIGSVVTARDISKQKDAEKALQESEELLRLSTELANVAAWEFNYETNTMTRSKNHDNLYGLEPQGNWAFETFVSSTHPDDREYSNAIIQNSVAIGGPDKYKFDFRVVYPDKTEHWLEVIGQVVKRNQKGEGLLVRGFLIDITERKRAEILLKSSQARYQELFEMESDAIFLIDNANGNIIEANQAAAKMYNYKLEELRLKKDLDLMVEPKIFKNLDQGKREANEIIKIPLRYHKKKDGTVFPVEITGRFFEIEGKSVRISAARDISERLKVEEDLKKSVELFSNAFNVSPAALSITRISDGKIINANESFLNLFEYSANEVIGYTSVELNMLNSEARKIIIKKQLETGGLINAELVSQTKQGKLINLLFSSKPMEIEGEACHITIMIDISDRKNAEKEIKKLNKELEKRVEDRTQKLEEKVNEVERMNKLFIGRELRMAELKQRIKDLEDTINSK